VRGLGATWLALALSACTGPDRLTDAIVSEGGTYFAALGDAAALSGSGGSGNPNTGNGGTTFTNDASLEDANAGFDWGPSKFDKNGGSSVTYQDHYNGEPCFATCHVHGIALAGTAYQANGTDPAANVEIGVWLEGTLLTSYTGSVGNFFTNSLSALDWTKAVIAVRSGNGTREMPANTKASGNCNLCHEGSHRITAP
jgi:hypothetical protein